MRIGGLASGIDVDSIVEKLMSARRVTVDKLYQQKQLIQWQREAYRDINTKMYDYRNNKLSTYRLEGTWLAKKAELTGNTAAIAAKAGPTASGQMTVKVQQLATAATVQSFEAVSADSNFDPSKTLADQISAGYLADFTATEFYVNGTKIEIDKNKDSLNDIINKINRSTNVSAYYDKSSGKLAFATKQTGLVNDATNPDSGGGKYITFTDPGNPGVPNDFVEGVLKITAASPKTAAQNAEVTVTINGLATNQTSTGNTLTVNGVELTLKEAGGAETYINISTDIDAIVEKVKSFIADYNEMLKTLNDKVSETRYRDFLPLTDAQKKEMKENEIKLWEEKAKSGMLRNDEILRKLIFSMRMAVSTPVDTGNEKYRTLTSIGIEGGPYTDHGKLYLVNEAKLRQAIEEDPEAINRLFTAMGTDNEGRSDVGIALRLYDDFQTAMNSIAQKAGSSLADSSYQDQSVIGRQLYELNKRIDIENDRLQNLEAMYYRQFAAMEAAINRYNAQAMFLQNAFGGSGA
jgi:flagellar hook-associated protein 2